MPDEDRGPFISALGWMNDVGQVPMNLLRGRFKSAGKKLVDVLGDIPDAVLPGKWIPHLSEESDNISGSEVLGIDRKKHPLFSGIADVGVGIAANPLSYLGVRGGKLKAGVPLTEGSEVTAATPAIDAVKDIANKAAEAMPEGLRKVIDQTARSTRRTANYLDVPDEAAALMKQAEAKGKTATQLSETRTNQIFGDMLPEERDIAGQALQRIRKTDAKDRSTWHEIDDQDAFIQSHPDLDLAGVSRVKQAIADTHEHGRFQRDEGIAGGVLRDLRDDNGELLLGDNYAHRRFTGRETAPLPEGETAAARSTSANERVFKTPTEVIQHLQKNPELDLEFDPLASGLSRARQQGQDLTKGALGRSFSGEKDFTLNEKGHMAKMDDAIAQMGDTDQAYQLKNMWEGIPERDSHAFTQALHKGNKLFKSAATFGVVMPRISFNVGNRVGGLWQVLSNDSARGTIGASSRRAMSDLLGAIDDGAVKLFGGKKSRWENGELTRDLTHWEDSFKKAKGNPNELRKLIAAHPGGGNNGKFLQEALDNGVIDAGWVDQEALLAKAAATPLRKRVNDIMQWPASIAQGVEQRMRYGTFKDLMKSGKMSAEEAAKTVRDTYLDYAQPGIANRRFRDIVPFGAFLSQNVKQQAGFVARHPVAGVAASQFYGDRGDNVRYPWMDNGLSIPGGLDEQGNPQYITSLRLPVEGLSAVPGLGSDDLYRDVGGSLQPLLKTAVSYATGKDTFTGGDFGTYDKLLGEHRGALGRTYNNLRSTGVLQPLTGPVDQLTNWLDDRKSLPERAVTGVTGVKMQSVNPALAKKIEIETYLKKNPDVMRSTRYFTPSGQEQDPGLTELLNQLNQAKETLARQRDAATVTHR